MALPLSALCPWQDSELWSPGAENVFTPSIMSVPLNHGGFSKVVLYNFTWTAIQWPLGEISKRDLPVLLTL